MIIFTIVVLLSGLKKEETSSNIEQIAEKFEKVRSAFLAYKKEEGNFCKDISLLKPYIEDEKDFPWSGYTLSQDQKYLIVSGKNSIEISEIKKHFGQSSFRKGNALHLSFKKLEDDNKKEPVAHFSVLPSLNITTTTHLTFDHKKSFSPTGKIEKMEWENQESRYSIPGTQTVRLRVQSQEGIWSPWFEQTLNIVEETGIKSVCAGKNAMYLLHKNGKVDGFGKNQFGEMGTGTTTSIEKLKKLTLFENVSQIDGGRGYCLIRTYDNQVLTLGQNHFGQLGQGGRMDQVYPKTIWGLEGILQVCAGDYFGAALSVSGDVYTWGSNEWGQLGGESNSFRETPIRVEGIEKIKSLACGSTHILALAFDGTVYSWGDNRKGQLGLGLKSKVEEPELTGLSSVKGIAAGQGTSFAILETGRVLSFGSNGHSQLGYGGQSEVLFPKEIPNLKNIVDLQTKSDFSIAIDEAGRGYKWGRNSNDTKASEEPVQIKEPKYIQSIAAGYDKAYILSIEEKIFIWEVDLDQIDPLIF